MIFEGWLFLDLPNLLKDFLFFLRLYLHSKVMKNVYLDFPLALNVLDQLSIQHLPKSVPLAAVSLDSRYYATL